MGAKNLKAVVVKGGQSTAVSAPDSLAGQAFLDIAGRILARVETGVGV